ncbi:hypothetical protein JQN72_09025 [Phycicoccus sp. CSK15P-2]|uniref:hypothetical protein n=1 Tax=Phycicoccus sp. CSK15P-2 TaxID=2807627 RepID=UPI001952962E|nr:hypothetical protein [Phycicoccus sp. CSK15P-2]MBM6404380.1 hypothetical protein [Phycicoccus sp. CSK15P-2]
MRHPATPRPVTARAAAALAAAALLGGCTDNGGADTTSPSATPTAGTSSPPPSATPTETGPTPESPSPRPSSDAGETEDDDRPTIPRQFRGVWTAVQNGDEEVTAADCERGGSTAGRIVEVTAREIVYFEPPAGVLNEVLASSPDRFRGDFSFEDVVNDGPDTLEPLDLVLWQGRSVLVTKGESPQTQVYKRCPG